jgi:hypothetical protein
MGKHKTTFPMPTYTLSRFAFLRAAAGGSRSRRSFQQIDIAMIGNAFVNRGVPNSYYVLSFAW